MSTPAPLMHPSQGEAVLRRISDRIGELLSAPPPLTFDQLARQVSEDFGCLREDVVYGLAQLDTITLPNGTLRIQAA